MASEKGISGSDAAGGMGRPRTGDVHPLRVVEIAHGGIILANAYIASNNGVGFAMENLG